MKQGANLSTGTVANNYPKLLKQLQSSGQLDSYLRQVGEDAAEMHENLLVEMQTNKNLPQATWRG